MAVPNTLVDLVKIYTVSAGTGAFTLGAPVDGYRGTEALADGANYSYSVQRDSNWEVGSATYLAATSTLVRTPIFSSNGGQAVNFPTSTAVAFVALAEDLQALAALAIEATSLTQQLTSATAFLNAAIAAAPAAIDASTRAQQFAGLSSSASVRALASEVNSGAYLAAIRQITGSSPTTGQLTIQAPTRAILSGFNNPVSGQQAFLGGLSGGSVFEFQAFDVSASVALDPRNGLFVPPASDTSGRSGAWVRTGVNGVFNVLWFGAVGDDVTDNTTAIQATVNYVCAIGAGVVFFPLGSFLCGPLTCPGYGNTPDGWRSIEFCGAAMPVFTFGTVPSAAQVSKKGSVIRCLPGQTQPMLTFPNGPYDGFSLYMLSIRRMTWRTYDNPQCKAIDAYYAIQLTTEDIQIDTGVYSPNCSQPTAPIDSQQHSCIGLVTPESGNAAVTNLKGTTSIVGYPIGLQVSEHTHGEYVNVSSCKYAVQVNYGNDPSHFDRLCIQQCTYGISGNGIQIVNIDQLNIEKFMSAADAVAQGLPAWMATVYDINDPNNALLGKANISLIRCGVPGQRGIEGYLTVSGGQNFMVTACGEPENPTSSHFASADTSVPSGVPTAIAYPGASHMAGFAPKQMASVTGSTNGNTLTVTAVASGALAVGQSLSDPAFGAFPRIPTITALGTGTGGVGTYTLDQPSNLSSRTFNGNDATMLVASRTGNYVVTALFSYTGNATGYRAGYIDVIGAGGSAARIGQDGRNAFGTDPTAFSVTSSVVNILAGSAIRVSSVQNSGATLTVANGSGGGVSGLVSIQRRGVLQ